MSSANRALVPILLIAVAGLTLRAGVAWRHGLWGDEVFSLAMATGHSVEHADVVAEPSQGDYAESPDPLPPSAFRAFAEHDRPPAGPGRVVRAVLMSDTNPPLYYLLLHAWTRLLGTGDLALRLFSVACSAGCFPLLWSLGKRFGGRRTAMPALLLFSFSPMSVFYATEGRMYSLVWVFALGGALLTHRVHRRPGTAVLAVWAVVGACGLLTHYFFLFAWVAFVVWLLAFPGRARRLAVISSTAIVGLLVAPWYRYLPESLAAWRVTRGWLEMRPENFRPVVVCLKFVGSSIFATGTWWGPAWHRAGQACDGALLLLVATALLVGCRRVLARRRPLLLWAWALATLAGPMVFDALRHTYTITVPRYAIAGLPGIFLLIALSLGAMSRSTRRAFLGLMLLGWAPAHLRMFANEARPYAPTRELGRLLASRAGTQDLVLMHSIPVGLTAVSRYIPPDCALERSEGLASWVPRLGVRRLPESLLKLARGRDRILLVRFHDVAQPADEADWLRRNAQFVGQDLLEGASVSYFVPPPGARDFGASAGPPSGP